MKKKINFIDALFSKEGHFLNDINNFSYLSDEFSLSYFLNGNISCTANSIIRFFQLHQYNKGHSIFKQTIFLFHTFRKIKSFNFNYILSCNYISLYLISLFFRKNFYVLIHFIPTNNLFLYKLILKLLLSRSNGFIFLNEYIMLDFERKISHKKSKLFVVNSRDLIFNFKQLSINKIKTVLFIGVLNEFKSIDMLVKLINTNYYDNVRFIFASKGIKKLIPNLISKNNVIIEDDYLSEDKYQNYMHVADFVFLSYVKNYGVRFSGTFIDAINNNCNTICNDIEIFKYFTSKYNTGYIFKNENELHNILLNLQHIDINPKMYNDFSSNKRKSDFISIINNYFNNV